MIFFFLWKASRLESTTNRIPLFHVSGIRMTEKNRMDIGNDGGRVACLPASIMVAGQVNGKIMVAVMK